MASSCYSSSDLRSRIPQNRPMSAIRGVGGFGFKVQSGAGCQPAEIEFFFFFEGGGLVSLGFLGASKVWVFRVSSVFV